MLFYALQDDLCTAISHDTILSIPSIHHFPVAQIDQPYHDNHRCDEHPRRASCDGLDMSGADGHEALQIPNYMKSL